MTRLDRASRYKRYNVPDEPELTQDVEHVLNWFWHLSERREQGMNGPCALTYTEIEAWLCCVPYEVTYEEISWILAMDQTFLDELHKAREEQKAEKEAERKAEKLRKSLRGGK